MISFPCLLYAPVCLRLHPNDNQFVQPSVQRQKLDLLISSPPRLSPAMPSGGRRLVQDGLAPG
uniref:Uncharacterized protein n=1 Tax=Arundo donax TaxID=35708 RepID=A0A0A9EE41_ARUDO